MVHSNGASFEIVTGNLVEEFNGVPFEVFNGVKNTEINPNNWSDFCIFYL
jgi:hypothetical protein